MPLSCYCGGEDHGWYFEPPNDYSVMPIMEKVYCSCGDLIKPLSVVAKFECFKGDHETMLPECFLCERCADLYFSFVELGFDCVSPTENMLDLLDDYRTDYAGEG